MAKACLAFFARIIPKIGPLKVLQLKTPTPETQRMFEASFNATIDRYKGLLTRATDDSGQPALANVPNFDTGELSGPGQYRLNDDTHAKLLAALAKQDFTGASQDVRRRSSSISTIIPTRPLLHHAQSKSLG